MHNCLKLTVCVFWKYATVTLKVVLLPYLLVPVICFPCLLGLYTYLPRRLLRRTQPSSCIYCDTVLRLMERFRSLFGCCSYQKAAIEVSPTMTHQSDHRTPEGIRHEQDQQEQPSAPQNGKEGNDEGIQFTAAAEEAVAAQNIQQVRHRRQPQEGEPSDLHKVESGRANHPASDKQLQEDQSRNVQKTKGNCEQTDKSESTDQTIFDSSTKPFEHTSQLKMRNQYNSKQGRDRSKKTEDKRLMQQKQSNSSQSQKKESNKQTNESEFTAQAIAENNNQSIRHQQQRTKDVSSLHCEMADQQVESKHLPQEQSRNAQQGEGSDEQTYETRFTAEQARDVSNRQQSRQQKLNENEPKPRSKRADQVTSHTRSQQEQSTNAQQKKENGQKVEPGLRAKAIVTTNGQQSEKGGRKQNQKKDEPSLSSKTQRNVPNRTVFSGAVASKPAIGVKMDLIEYADSEWKTDRERSKRMLAGYVSVYNEHNLHDIIVIRGDNYCAIRSVCYQMLVLHHEYFTQHVDRQSFTKDIKELKLFEKGCQYGTDRWSFARRLKLDDRSVQDAVLQCVAALCDLLASLHGEDMKQREQHVTEYLNSSDQTDVQIMEAFKALMMLRCVHLYHRYTAGEDNLPLFCYLMFARDTSPDPHHMMNNHLNRVGNEGGLEQVEMYLLANTLQIDVCTYRVGESDKPDFVTHYKDEAAEGLPVVDVVSEDDRHYNVVCERHRGDDSHVLACGHPDEGPLSP